MQEHLDEWQTLIGSALGPFLAVILSAIGFWIKSTIESEKERKEYLRRIEIGITRSLDDTFKTRIKLQFFVSRLKKLIAEIKAITDEFYFSFDSVNYPVIRDIYRDTDAPNFKVKSYYLHNKLLWADSGVKETNETVKSLKNDFAELQRKNELHIILMRQNQKPRPLEQRAEYVKNLEAFAKAIDEFIQKFMGQNIEIMTQIKIYNEHMRKKYGRWFLWKHEGTNLKYFRYRTEQIKFARNLNAIEHIDKVINKEVMAEVKEAEDRIAEL